MPEYGIGDRVRYTGPDEHLQGVEGKVLDLHYNYNPEGTVKFEAGPEKTCLASAWEVTSVGTIPDEGMTSDQLSGYVGEFITACQGRIKGVGDEQYSSGEGQKFETLRVPDLLKWAREEVQDIANYAAMLDIRLARLQKSFEGK